MPYLIDGHNLIPKLGLHLEEVDDELQLVAALQEYGRRSRKPIEVYFDGAPAGHSGSRKFGQVTAHFVHQQSTADVAIIARLKRLSGAARNWTVVSSDRDILRAAAHARARTETSEQFAGRLRRDPSGKSRGEAPHASRDGGLSEQEIRHWLDLFKKR